MTLYGYARVSTSEKAEKQTLALQLKALRAAGVETTHIFSDRLSGSRKDRPALHELFEKLHAGDTLVVWKLDRLGRSMPHLTSMLETLRERGCDFRSLTEGMDTSTAQGELLYNVMAAFAAFEVSLIRERTRAGLAASKNKTGRRLSLSREQVALAHKLRDEGTSMSQVARMLGVSRQTIYSAFEREAVFDTTSAVVRP